MESSSPRKRKDVWLIVLSAFDVITGILSLVITALAVQVIAVMASGLTLVKAIKVAIQSEKTAIFVKPVAVYAVRKLTRSEKMKNFFGKIKENVKNNPITLITSIIELAVCGGLGYVLLGFFDKFEWSAGWKLYAFSCGAAFIIYAMLVILTIYLGHDNPVFAYIRKAVKFIGGESALNAMNKAEEEVREALNAVEKEKQAREAEEARVAEERAKDEEIYAKILEAERAEKERLAQLRAIQEEAEKRAKIAAYKAAHPGE